MNALYAVWYCTDSCRCDKCMLIYSWVLFIHEVIDSCTCDKCMLIYSWVLFIHEVIDSCMCDKCMLIYSWVLFIDELMSIYRKTSKFTFVTFLASLTVSAVTNVDSGANYRSETASYMLCLKQLHVVSKMSLKQIITMTCDATE